MKTKIVGNNVEFKDIPVGNIFFWENEVWIKTDPFISKDKTPPECCAVCLNDGAHGYYDGIGPCQMIDSVELVCTLGTK